MVNAFSSRRPGKAKSVLDVPFSEYDPITCLPKSIRIGDNEFTPFVSLRQVRDHLTILAAFHAVRESSGEDAYPRMCEAAASQYQRWVQYVQPAQDRNGNGSGELKLPALGVLMCWHAHMLNPRLFDRECDGAYRSLREKPFPLNQIAEAIRHDSIRTDLADIAYQGGENLKTFAWDPTGIAAAVQRQGKFIANMASIKWLDAEALDIEAISFVRGIVRYHAWLDLMHSMRGKQFLVPTLDIDLAWHTHQLQGKAYKKDSEEALGMFLDHDDNAGESRLGDGLDLTSDLWKARYGYDYTF